MSVNIYRLKGKLTLRNGETISFSMDIPGTKPEQSIERVYSNLSGIHRIKRRNIRVTSIEVINPKETRNKLVQTLWREVK